MERTERLETQTGSGIRRLAIVGLAFFAPVLQVVGAGGAHVNLALADPLVFAAIPWIVWRFLSSQARLPLIVCALAMGAVTMLSTLTHAEISFYVRSPLGLAAGIGKALFVWAYFYAAVNLVDSRRNLLLLMKTWIAGSGLLAISGIAGSLAHQIVRSENRFALDYRAQGTMGDPNLFSTHLGVSFFLALLYHNLSERKHGWIWLVMLLQVAGMIMSASRSGLLGFAAGLGLLFIFQASAKWKVAALAVLAAGIAATVFVPGMHKVVGSNPITGRLATTTVDVRETDRVKLWQVAWNNFLNAPLLGVGYENGAYVNRSGAGKASEAHNTYLSLASELGAGGVAIFLVTLFYLPVALIKDTRNPAVRNKRSAVWLLIAAFTNIAVVGIALNADNYRGLWLLMAVAYWFRLAYLKEPAAQCVEGAKNTDSAVRMAQVAC